MGVVREELHDRVGDVRGVGRGPPLVADRAERLAGGRAHARPRRGCGSGSRARATRTATPSGRSRARHRVARRTPRRRAARPRASRRRTGCPARSDRSAATACPSVHVPVEDLVGRDDQQVRARARRRPRPGRRSRWPLRRIARSGSSAQPSTSVQAAAWTTTSGRSRSSRAPIPSGASRSNASRSQAIGPAGPVNGASARAATSALPETAGRPGDRDAHQSRSVRSRRPARRGGRLPGRQPVAVLARVPAIPVARAGRAPPRLVGPVPVDRRRQAVLERGPRLPAERRQLRAVHRVPPVVARAGPRPA